MNKQALSPKTLARAKALRATRMQATQDKAERVWQYKQHLIHSSKFRAFVTPFSTRRRRIFREEKKYKALEKDVDRQRSKWRRTKNRLEKNPIPKAEVVPFPTQKKHKAIIMPLSSHPAFKQS